MQVIKEYDEDGQDESFLRIRSQMRFLCEPGHTSPWSLLGKKNAILGLRFRNGAGLEICVLRNIDDWRLFRETPTNTFVWGLFEVDIVFIPPVKPGE